MDAVDRVRGGAFAACARGADVSKDRQACKAAQSKARRRKGAPRARAAPALAAWGSLAQAFGGGAPAR